jgi:hypothetical protein
MKVDGFFTLQDYFNYYMSGFVWIVDVLLILSFIKNEESTGILEILGNSFDVLGGVASSIVLILVPYITGYLFYYLSQELRRSLVGKERKNYPSPRDGVLLYPSENAFFDKRRIPKKEADKIIALAKKRFDVEHDEKKPGYYFNPIRSYLLEIGGESAKRTMRTRDLMSLLEGFLIPVPLFFGLLTGLIIYNFHITIFANFAWLSKFAGYIIGLKMGSIVTAVTFWLMLERYYKQELEWVKRVYRGFLVIESINNKKD